MRRETATRERGIARLAARQHGVVSTAQLAEAGLGSAALSRRVEAGRLHRIHRGVYAVGHAGLSWRGIWMAGVLACGEGAVLSHLSAAYLWRLLDPRNGPTHVSVPGSGGRARRQGIRIHRRRALDRRAITRRFNIPVTTPAQTIADLDGSVPPARLRRAIRQAEVLGMQTGVKRSEPTRSELEDLFLQLCKRSRLPKPEVNVRVADLEVDFLWRAERLVVETDGYKYHRGAQAFENDHDRELMLRDQGYRVRSFTYRQVTRQPAKVAATVRKALERK